MSKSERSATDYPGAGATSSGLIDRVREHDPLAWQRLVDLNGPLIYRWCRLTGLQSTDAADITQEVFAAVAANIAKFRREKPNDSFRGWLWTITRNKMRDLYRRRDGKAQAKGGTEALRRLAEVPEDPPESTDGDTHARADNSLEHRAMNLVRSTVEQRTWQAFWMLAIEGRSAVDVAEELGMNRRTAYEAKYRVLRRLRQELQGLSD
jgi:RNA polymerase sigma-70 factor (ECF subfamily)